ncbi:hypothetical protein HN358_02030 [Candidatus Uhrbacteria bacterium]|jgi:hypothetical protein|nr:hypothetical protein [Candidatus Uhrbacteria bacterium]MBT7716882.1 hypothetical protein [Candidatus Uhrbacteria bacterium]
MDLDTNGLPYDMIAFLNTSVPGVPPETTFELVAEAGALNKSDRLALENEEEVVEAMLTDGDVMPIPEDMFNVDNDPWLIVGQIMEWEIGMELPTLHQLCFAAGTLRHRTRHTEWELDTVNDFRGMPQHLLGWYDRAEETPHPHAYRLACWMVLNAILFITEDEVQSMDEPWDTSMVDLNGLRLIDGRLKELDALVKRIGLGDNAHLGYDDIRHRVRLIARLIWQGFEIHFIDDDGNPVDDDGERIDVLKVKGQPNL